MTKETSFLSGRQLMQKLKIIQISKSKEIGRTFHRSKWKEHEPESGEEHLRCFLEMAGLLHSEAHGRSGTCVRASQGQVSQIPAQWLGACEYSHCSLVWVTGRLTMLLWMSG